MIRFRTATADELDLMLDWAAEEGWNPGLDDAAAFHAADPEGFFLALEGDAPVGAISVVNHNDTFAFLGLYIVAPSHRGRNIGYSLWQHALAHAGARTVGLDGVAEQQANYAASGFTHAGSTQRFSGEIAGRPHGAIREAVASDVPELVQREAAASGSHKPHYMTEWFTSTGTRRTFVHPGGFLSVRRCREGAKAGPLVAADAATARDLLQHAASVFGSSLMIDVPASEKELAAVCRDLGLAPSFETARMYRGTAPVPGAGIYAVASLELG